MSLQTNLLDQVRADAVREARGVDAGRLSALGANARGTSGAGTPGGDQLTRANADGQTVGPFVVDASPVDSPLFFIL